MNRNSLIFMLAAVLVLFVSSCEEDPIPVDQNKTMKDLAVPAGFNLNMVKSINVSVKLPSTIDYATTNRIVEIWSEGVEGKPCQIIKTGSANREGLYEATFSIPAASKKVFTNCFAGWRSLVVDGPGLKLTDGVLTVDYNLGYGNTPPKPRQGITGPIRNEVLASPVLMKSGIENVLKNGDFSGNKFGVMDTWSSAIEADGIWYATDEAKTYGSVISQEGNFFARINSQKYSAGGFTQLIPASAGQIVTFSGDARGFDSQQDVYLYLVPRNEFGELIDIFSYNMVNPGIIWVNATVAGNMPEGTTSCQILFYKGSTGIVDFDNAIVRVNDPESDRDEDGVLDWEDLYPDNVNQAFDDIYPAKDQSGTLLFEDAWPSTGDFDFNDLVVDYQINQVSNSSNKIVEIDIVTRVRAIGGSNHHGFGLQIYLDPALIDATESNLEPVPGTIRLNQNGTEMGQGWATFILFTNSTALIPQPMDGRPTFNTTMGYHYIIPSQNRFRIFLKKPMDPEQVSLDKINPFIFREDDRSHEIHLKGYPPTDLANPSLFGTGDDASDTGSGSFYQTQNGIPWAINVPATFEYPVEKAEILAGYSFFDDWVISGGNKYSDWYLDKQGYRNWPFIYRW